MLLSSISANIISSSAISMITTPGLPQYGAPITVGLIALLSIKEFFQLLINGMNISITLLI